MERPDQVDGTVEDKFLEHDSSPLEVVLLFRKEIKESERQREIIWEADVRRAASKQK